MPTATTKHSFDVVLERCINNVLKPNLSPALPSIFPHEKFNGQPRLNATVTFVAALASQFCAQVVDSSGLAPRLSPAEIVFFNPGTVADVASLVHDRLRNRNDAFIEQRVMSVIKSIAPTAKPATSFESLGWNKGFIENVLKSIRAGLARHLRFDTSLKQMKDAANGQDVINFVRADFHNQARLET